jgi:hypothetical protein
MSRAQASSQLATKTTVKDAIQRAQSGNAFQLCRAQASSQTIQTRLQNYELILTEQKKMVEKSVSVLKHIKNGWHK